MHFSLFLVNKGLKETQYALTHIYRYIFYKLAFLSLTNLICLNHHLIIHSSIFYIFTENTLKTKLGIWAQSKQDLLMVQQESHREEHIIKLTHMKEKHQASLKHDQECHDQKLKMDREEHEIKLQILKLQRDKLLEEMK